MVDRLEEAGHLKKVNPVLDDGRPAPSGGSQVSEVHALKAELAELRALLVINGVTARKEKTETSTTVTLRKGEVSILALLTRAFPAGMTKAELMKRIKSKSNTVRAYVGTLKKRDLVTVSGDTVTASDRGMAFNGGGLV